MKVAILITGFCLGVIFGATVPYEWKIIQTGNCETVYALP